MIDQRHVAEAFAHDRLRLFILPTEQCNFRCVYCYEDFSVGRMPREVIDGLKALISRRASSLSRLRLSWFGGEPTTAIDIVREIMTHALETARAHDLIVESDMTTNAYRLNRGMLADLCDLLVTEFQITLDGPEALHNQTRALANGRGTFERIWENLLQAKSSPRDFKITLRIHITPDNCEAMPCFVDLLRDTFFPDPRFSVFFKAVGHWGGPHDSKFAVLGDAAERNAIKALMTRLLGEQSEPPSTPGDEVCYAAKPNNFLIRADGRIEKCTVALNKPANLVGNLNADGTLTFKNKVHQNWLQGWNTMNEGILGCPLWTATKFYDSQDDHSNPLHHANGTDPVPSARSVV
jgi:uncharacterized protein